jgi:hypothetical protein
LFECLSTSWTDRTISLDMALQAEYAYVSDEADDDGFRKQDVLCLSLHKISTRLITLCIDNEAVFPEFFCSNGLQGLLQTHWPYLETLRLENINESSAFSGLARYADGAAPDETLL